MATLIRRKKHCGTRLRDSAPHPTGKRLKESRNPVGTTAIGVSGPQVGAKTGASVHTILTYAYEKAFITNNYGYSSAVSMIIFVILIIFSTLTNRKQKED